MHPNTNNSESTKDQDDSWSNYEWTDNDMPRSKRKLFSNTTRLYFLLAILASTAAFATLFFWPAAFAAATTALTAAAALTVFGFTPLAFLAGLSVLATASVAAAIVFTAAVALYLGAKLTVAALKLTGQIVGSLFHKIQDMRNPPATNMAASNILEESNDKDTLNTVDISARLLTILVQASLSEVPEVARRSKPNETKTLNRSKVKLMTTEGRSVPNDTIITFEKSQIATDFSELDIKDLLSLVKGSGYGFFRTFHNDDPSKEFKPPIPVKLV